MQLCHLGRRPSLPALCLPSCVLTPWWLSSTLPAFCFETPRRYNWSRHGTGVSRSIAPSKPGRSWPSSTRCSAVKSKSNDEITFDVTSEFIAYLRVFVWALNPCMLKHWRALPLQRVLRFGQGSWGYRLRFFVICRRRHLIPGSSWPRPFSYWIVLVAGSWFYFGKWVSAFVLPL